jgi:hypothetical protein
MSGSSTISIDLLPGVFAVTGGGPICSGVPVHVGLTGSELGVNYQLYNGPSAYGAVVAGTGSLLDLGLVTTAGTYTVMAINSTTTCINGMSGSTTITVTPSVIPSVNIISGMGDTVCSGISNTFFPLSLNEGTAPVYKWSVNGIYAGVGGTYSYIPANGDVVSVVLTSNAVCAVPDTAVGAITIAVQTSQMPYVNANVTPGNIVCQGQRVTLTAAPVYGGTSPSYLWVVNGSVVVSGPSYYYAPANGDDVYCTMKSNFRCLTIDSVLSGIVHLTVDSMILPLVTISSDPGALITIGESVTLKAIVTNAVGTSLSYLWLLNGVSTGNNTNQFISTTLGYPSPDSLTCLVTCTGGVCGPLTGFNWIYISAFPVEVNQFASNERNITVVPNPSKGDIMINGSFGTPLAAKDELSIELVNTIGQVIYTHKASAYFGNIGEHLLLSNEIVNGTYMLNVQSSTMSKTFHIVIQR